jgi:hypothetical protein
LLVNEYALQCYIIITNILNSLNISYENVKQQHRIYGMCVIFTYKEYEFSLSWSNLLSRDKDWLVEILEKEINQEN